MHTDEILSLLHKNRHAFLSGQKIAAELGVTRAAVWKAIEALRAEGYVFESVRARGYRLISVPDRLGEREILPGLETKVLGRRIHYFDTIDSTNTYAARIAAEGAPEGTVVVSDTQTAGRGRLGRKWVSPPGQNIHVSVILRPKIAPAEAPLITLAAAVALVKAVRALYPLDAWIKWPNDLHIGGKKAAGILTEMSAEPQVVRHVILGVGIDVNMPIEELPEEIREISTSVMLALGRRADRAELLRRFLLELEAVYAMLTSGDRAGILDAWRDLSSTLGRRVLIKTLRGEITGTALDVDGEGSLVIERDGAGVESVSSGDVFYLKG